MRIGLIADNPVNCLRVADASGAMEASEQGFWVQGSGVARQDSSHKDCIDKVLKKRHDSCNKKRLFLGTFRLFSPHSVSCSQPVVNL
jgi:hypothetical protein